MGFVLDSNKIDMEYWDALWEKMSNEDDATILINLKTFMCAI